MEGEPDDDGSEIATSDHEDRQPTPPAPLGDVLGRVLTRIVERGRRELDRAAQQGRLRLELRQLQKDRDAFWIRLGKTAYRLSESGELDHPAITKAMRRIDEIEDRIRDVAIHKVGATEE